MKKGLLKYLGLSLIIILTIFHSCKDTDKLSNEVLVTIGNSKFTKNDLQKTLPSAISSEDSAIMAEQIIRSWIDEQLLYMESCKKLQDTSEIHEKVKKYRKELYVYEFSQQLIAELTDTVVEMQEIEEYYNKYLDNYILNEPVVKVHYLTMSSQVIGYYVERDMVKTTPLSNLDRLIEFCKGTGRKVNIIDDWIRVSELKKIIPCIQDITNESLIQNNYYECFDDVTRYLLIVDDYKESGEHTPIDILIPSLREIILHKRKNESMNIYRQNLYSHAKNDGSLVINY